MKRVYKFVCRECSKVDTDILRTEEGTIPGKDGIGKNLYDNKNHVHIFIKVLDVSKTLKATKKAHKNASI